MKKLFTTSIMFFAIIGLWNIAFAQMPQAFNYQAVARYPSGVLIANQMIGIEFLIHRGSPSGTVSYSETDTATTNKFGLFTESLGRGTPVTGAFDTIYWNFGNYWLQVEIDPRGGSNYTDMGTTQLLTVPYAMFAGSSIVAVDTFTVQSSSWVLVSGSQYKYVHTTPLIDQQVINKGTIQVSDYCPLYPGWYGWPDVVAGEAGLRFCYSLNNLTLIADNFTSHVPYTMTIKVIIMK